MIRYFCSVIQKFSRLFRHVVTHVMYRLMFFQYCSIKLMIIYLMLVTFSTTVLVYQQSKKPDHQLLVLPREEVIQVN